MISRWEPTQRYISNGRADFARGGLQGALCNGFGLAVLFACAAFAVAKILLYSRGGSCGYIAIVVGVKEAPPAGGFT